MGDGLSGKTGSVFRQPDFVKFVTISAYTIPYFPPFVEGFFKNNDKIYYHLLDKRDASARAVGRHKALLYKNAVFW